MNFSRYRSTLIVLHRLLLIFGVIVLGGCAEPKVKSGVVLQHSSNKIANVYVDVSNAYVSNPVNIWPKVMTSGFESALVLAFARNSVSVELLNLQGEVRTKAAKPGDYLLSLSFLNGFYGSSGTGATYQLVLTDMDDRRKVWSSSIFVSGTTTILTQDMGAGVARSMVDAMSRSGLFSETLMSHSPVGSVAASDKFVFTTKQQEGFEKFKSLKFPKAFVIGDTDIYFYA